MTREQLFMQSLETLREMAKAKGVKSITKYRKAELVDLILGNTVDEKNEPASNFSPNIDTSKQYVQSNEQAGMNDNSIPLQADLRSGYSLGFSTPRQNSGSYQPNGGYQPKPLRRNDYGAQQNMARPQQNNGRNYRQNGYQPGYQNGYQQGNYQQQGYQNGYQQQNNYQQQGYQNGYQQQNNYQQQNGYQQNGYMNRNQRSDSSYLGADSASLNPGLHEMLESGECFEVKGMLDIVIDDDNSYGFLRVDDYYNNPNDIYVSNSQVRRFRLRTGDYVTGKARPSNDNGKFAAMMLITSINGREPEESFSVKRFEELTPVFPNSRLTLENPTPDNLAIRLIDLLSPIGRGQRGMIVSQPKAGKTTLLKAIAHGIETNYPDIHLIVLLIDERPEEVTDMKRFIKSEVVYSTFDELPEHHTRVAELVHGKAMRLVENGEHVVILMDSITRLARAYNLTMNSTGKTLSGGMDPGALHKPKRFFGSARNIEDGGSLTIIATALVETGSRMDDMVYEEFKGTGNMEVHLDRKLSEKRIFPAIDIYKSGTRRDDLLLSNEERECANSIRRMLSNGNTAEVTEQVISMLDKTKTNAEFIPRFKSLTTGYEKDGYVLGGKPVR